MGGMGRGQDEREFNGRDEDDDGIRVGLGLGLEESQRRIGQDEWDLNGWDSLGFTGILWDPSVIPLRTGKS